MNTKNRKASDANSDLDQALSSARQHYLDQRPASILAHNKASQSMPGGNTRTVLHHGPIPLRVVSGSGCRLTDADGFEYVNFLGEYTAGLFGHDNKTIRDAIQDALGKGLSLSAHNQYEAQLSDLVCQRFPGVELVRFTNSGTEANLMSLSLARHWTGKSKVMVFKGAYHGGVLTFKDGSAPINVPFDYVIAPYNDIDVTRELINTHQDDLACILVEPMQGSGGCIPGDAAFLNMMREETRNRNILLIFDEVMTSRLSPTGLHGQLGINPDLVTLGKYLGGGLSFGAFGGRQEIMDLFNPQREDALPHAGTFNNNTLTMAAGIAALDSVLDDKVLIELNERGDELREDLNGICQRYGVRMQITGVGSLMGLHGQASVHPYSAIRNINDTQANDDRILELTFLDLLDQGYYIARRGFVSLMLTIGDAEIAGFKAAFERVLNKRLDLFQ